MSEATLNPTLTSDAADGLNADAVRAQEWAGEPFLHSDEEAADVLAAHPDVLEVAVVAVPDERWDERPLACVVLRPDAQVTPAELCDFLTDKVAHWWLPERWTFIDEVPKTSVGKYDKKVLRSRHEQGDLEIRTMG